MCVTCGCNDHPSSALAPFEIGQRRPFATSGVRFSPYDGTGAGAMSAPALRAARTIRMEADVLGENKKLADSNRAHFKAHGVTALNLVSSPGSGKTTLLCASIQALKVRKPGLPIAVIEGDQQTSLDTDRIRATGVPAIQVNTGRGCHLDAQMVAEAFNRLDLHDVMHRGRLVDALLFVENVGNLVCPALWDLGEAAKVVVLSVTEGEDKPLKYPDMFAASTLMVINKIDLLPHVNFEVPRCIEYARRANPDIEVLLVSATRGDGMSQWLDWLLPPNAVDPQP